MKKAIILASILTAATATSAFASVAAPHLLGNQLNHGTYVGVNLGRANLNYKKSFLTDDPQITSVGSVDDAGFAGRLFMGYQFNQYIALETGFVMLQKVQFNNITVAGSSTTVDESFKQSILDVMLKGILPLPDGYDLFAKAGYANVMRDDIEVTGSNGTSASSDTTDTQSVPVVGGGAEYHLTRNVIADVSYLHYFGTGDLPAADFGSAGLSYLFG